MQPAFHHIVGSENVNPFPGVTFSVAASSPGGTDWSVQGEVVVVEGPFGLNGVEYIQPPSGIDYPTFLDYIEIWKGQLDNVTQNVYITYTVPNDDDGVVSFSILKSSEFLTDAGIFNTIEEAVNSSASLLQPCVYRVINNETGDIARFGYNTSVSVGGGSVVDIDLDEDFPQIAFNIHRS